MRSLRSRLIVGAAVVAIIPLALAMYLLSERIEDMVQEQAEERLGAALGGLQADLRADGEAMVEKLRILAADPPLKRLVLVRPAGSREPADYLAERRFLLGLDFLQVADTTGAVVADGSMVPSSWARGPGDSAHTEVPVPRAPFGLAVTEAVFPAGLVLSATAPILYEGQPAGLVHGGRLLDAGFLERLRASGSMELVLRDGAGSVKAMTLEIDDAPVLPKADRRSEPSGAGVDRFADTGVTRVVLDGRSFLCRSYPLELGSPPFATITGLVPTASADRTIASLRSTSVLLGLLGLGLAIGLGVLWSSQISRPVERLAAFSRKVAQGEWDEPLSLHSVRELETLVEALDRMRRDLATYRDRLVTSERQAAWSQMARRVAHEIKNPLTPIAVSVSDLKRSYDQGRDDFPAILDQAVRTISEEVATMKHLLQEFSDFARLPPPRFAPCRLSELLADLGALYGREVEAGRLVLPPRRRDGTPPTEVPPDVLGATFAADAGQIRQALVNLVKNGLEATGETGCVTLDARLEGRHLDVSVSDTGPGLNAEQRANLFLPGFSTKAEGSGLGLTLVERIVNDHGGTIAVESIPGRGTVFRIRLPLRQEG